MVGDVKPLSALKLILGFPSVPFLVVMRITPFAPLTPYTAEAEASFRIENDFISSVSTVRDMDFCQDIVQETFVKFWDVQGQFSDNPGTQSIRGWLYAATRNKCLDYLKSKDHKNKFRTQTLELITKEAPPEFDELELREIQQQVDRILSELPETTRKVYYMNRQQGLSYREIANMSGLSQKNIEFHISKALNVLRKQMKDFYVLAFFLYI